MSVQAYWNCYIGPINQENGEWEYPSMEIAEQMGKLGDIENKAASFRGVDYTLRNRGGENLELEVSGNAYRVLRFLDQYRFSVDNPFLVLSDTVVEARMVKEELEDGGDTP